MSYDNNLSMSIMVQNRKISNEISIPKTSPSIWIPSKNVQECYRCKELLVFGKENIIAEFVVEYFVQIVQIDGALYQVW
jgi:hypothetical protein